MNNGKKSADKAWYEQWFGREYLEIYAHRNESEAKNDIDAAERLLNLEQNQPILDLACGGGRHSIELARRGYTVTGIDLSEELLKQAEEQAREAGFDIPFYRHDMRDHPFHQEFGSLINMFTSFGYFENDAENGRIMAAINRALIPRGKFLIDYINMNSVLAGLVPEDEKQINDKQVVQKRRFHKPSKRLIKVITITDEQGSREFTESVRLYSREEMLKLAKANGLAVDQTLGSLAGEEYVDESPRLILVGHKP